MKDYLFVGTEEYAFEGEEILCEAKSLEDAWNILLYNYNFAKEELEFIEEMSVEDGEMLGLDTY